MAATRDLAREGGLLAVCDRNGAFYPPAAIACGWRWDDLLLVRGVERRDELWALEQALRSPAVAVAWGWLDDLPPRDFRRLQLAAEAGPGLGFLFRPARARGAPSWAQLQLGVTPLINPRAGPRETQPGEPRPPETRRYRVEVLRRRGAAAGQVIELEVTERGELRRACDDPAAAAQPTRLSCSATHPLPAFSPLADPAAAGYSA